MNLGTNAGHAMRDKGGRFTVTLDEFVVPSAGAADGPNLSPGAYLRLSAADTGHGMEQATLQQIFEPFFTTKPVGEGTGLGLSVVHGIIKHHGGDITVTSQLGVGTTFCIYLPRAEDGAVPPERSEQAPQGGRGCLLVVDDEEALVNMMEQKLTRLGYEVVACYGSIEALRQFRAAPRRFAAVITDQNMPQLSGSDLARQIAQIQPGTPVILCSGSGNILVRARELRPTVCDCVLKPVDFGELSRTLRRLIDQKPELQGKEP
jgi:CheY-like chemotaxis protein